MVGSILVGSSSSLTIRLCCSWQKCCWSHFVRVCRVADTNMLGPLVVVLKIFVGGESEGAEGRLSYSDLPKYVSSPSGDRPCMQRSPKFEQLGLNGGFRRS